MHEAAISSLEIINFVLFYIVSLIDYNLIYYDLFICMNIVFFLTLMNCLRDVSEASLSFMQKQ